MLVRTIETIRAALAARFAQSDNGRSELLHVGIDLIDHRREVEFVFHPVRGEAFRMRCIDRPEMRLFTPTILIQLYRQEYHRAFGGWESYVPVPGYRYTCTRLARPRMDSIEPLAMEMSITRDPCHARDVDGEELECDMCWLEDVFAAIDASEAIRLGPLHSLDAARDAISHRRSFRPVPVRRDDPQDRRTARLQDPRYVERHGYEYLMALAQHQGWTTTAAEAHARQADYAARAQMHFGMMQARARPARPAEPHPTDYGAAEARGWELLKENLSPEQLASLDTKKYFEVIGGTTGLRYYIHTGKSFNVSIIGRAGQPGAIICFQPSGGLCTGDIMLTQKLALELREMDALRVANTDSMQSSTWLDRELAATGHSRYKEGRRQNAYQIQNAYQMMRARFFGNPLA